MVKHFIWIILCSIILIIFQSTVTNILHYLGALHHTISSQLSLIFADEPIGLIIRKIIALLLLPLSISSLAAGAYYAVQRTTMPYLATVLWVSWIIMATGVSLHFQAV